MKAGRLVLRLLGGESGQGMVEYGLLLGLVALVVLAAVFSLGDSVETAHVKYKEGVDAAVNKAGGT